MLHQLPRLPRGHQALDLILMHVAATCGIAVSAITLILRVDLQVQDLAYAHHITGGAVLLLALFGILLTSLLIAYPPEIRASGRIYVAAMAAALIPAAGIVGLVWSDAYRQTWIDAFQARNVMTSVIATSRHKDASAGECGHIAISGFGERYETANLPQVWAAKSALEAAYDLGCIDQYDLASRMSRLRVAARGVQPLSTSVNLFRSREVLSSLHLSKRALCELDAMRHGTPTDDAGCAELSDRLIAPCPGPGGDSPGRTLCELNDA